MSQIIKQKETTSKTSDNFVTKTEIFQQPNIWLKQWENYNTIKNDLKNYLKDIFNNQEYTIILTGAGSSAFIGSVLFGAFKKYLTNPVNIVATTDIVTHPHYYFNKNKKYLIISFARSGNSPESAQVVYLADEFTKNVKHLILTCNPNSLLTKAVSDKNHYNVFMPPEADDKGLAMTSSFTTMLLTGLLISRLYSSDSFESEINTLHDYAKSFLSNYDEDINSIADLDFTRAIFLGSGMLYGIAKESHLKLQELTDGVVICKYDSFMGFRHGPKAVVNENTLLVYLFSNNPYANQYEIDLVNSMSDGRKSLYSIGLMENYVKTNNIDFKILLSGNSKKIDEDFLPVVSVLPAQLLGFYKSIKLGLNPDSPSTNGMIHRVVQGVKVYPIKNK